MSVKTVTEILPIIVEIGERAARWNTAIPEANAIQIYAADDKYSIWQDSRGHTLSIELSLLKTTFDLFRMVELLTLLFQPVQTKGDDLFND